MYYYKRIFLLSLSLILSIFLKSQKLSFPNFLETTGLELVAELAHPIKYNSGFFLPKESKCIIFHNEFYFILQFTDGWTIINFKEESGIIKSANLFNTNYILSVPFAATSMLLAYVSENKLEDDPIWKQILKYYSNGFGKELNQFNGYELTIAVLAWQWAVKVAEVEKNQNSEPPVQSSNQVTRMIDGIEVSGSSEFTRRVEEALEVIKKYDIYLYENFFENTDNKHNLVRRITYNNSNSYSTIADDGIINLHGSNAYFHHDNIFRSNRFTLANTLVHEMTHLYQHYEYSKLYNCSQYAYRLRYTYDPIEIAKHEITAYNVANEFLNKILEKVPEDGNKYIRTTVAMTINENNKKKGHYNILWEAGTYLFESRTDKPSCGQSCMTMFSKELDKFGNIYEAYAMTVRYLKWLYL